METQKATSWNCNLNQSAKILYSHRQTILSLPHWASLAGSLAWYRSQGLQSPPPPVFGSWICHLLVTWPWANYLNLLYFTSVFSSFSYLLCNSNIILKLGNSKQQTFILSHSFFGPGIWKWVSCVVLAQGLLWGCHEDVGQGCSHLKTCSTHWRGCWQGPQFLAVWTSPKGCWCVWMTRQLSAPRGGDLGENRAEARCPLWYCHFCCILSIVSKPLSQLMFGGKGIRLHPLKGGKSKNFWLKIIT